MTEHTDSTYTNPQKDSEGQLPDTAETAVSGSSAQPVTPLPEKREIPGRLPLFINTFFALLLLFLLIGGILLQTALVPLTAEAGDPLPTAEAFVRYPFLPHTCLTDLSDPSLAEIGTHTVRFFLWGRYKNTTLTVADTKAPAFTLQPLSVLRGADVSPEAFVSTVSDVSAVTFRINERIPTQAGKYTVTVTAEDAHGNTAAAETEFTVLSLDTAVTVEAGLSLTQFTRFLSASLKYAAPSSDFDEALLCVPGEHPIFVKISGKLYPLMLTVKDTVAPTADLQDVFILQGAPLSAEEFVVEARDATAVRAAFADGAPNVTEAGSYNVPLLLTDAGGNTLSCDAILHVLPIPAVITAEAGTPFVDLLEQFRLPEANASLGSFPIPGTLYSGTVRVPVHTDYGDFSVDVVVTDTKAPEAVARTVYLYENETATPSPADFVTGIRDASAVTAEFVEEPDFSILGEHAVSIRLTDASGNTSVVTATLSVLADTDAPTILGIRDLSVYVGGTVSYRAGVSATDGSTSVTVQVDASRVNLKKPGTYTVYYTATDAAGNTSTLAASVTVLEIPYSLISDYANDILDDILTEGMTQRQKARAIYDWMTANISYAAYADKTYWMRAAYHGFTGGKGDCYVYYAMSRILLDCAGIENMEIQRDDPDKPHYWNLVNCGDGWYHFDTCPHYKNYPLECFMLTDAEVKRYSETCVKDYYSFDESLYPDTP